MDFNNRQGTLLSLGTKDSRGRCRYLDNISEGITVKNLGMDLSQSCTWTALLCFKTGQGGRRMNTNKPYKGEMAMVEQLFVK